MLEMINVTKTYPGGSVALQDINVRIEQGERICVCCRTERRRQINFF